MKNMAVQTVKIVKGAGFVIMNLADFRKGIHEEYVEGVVESVKQVAEDITDTVEDLVEDTTGTAEEVINEAAEAVDAVFDLDNATVPEMDEFATENFPEAELLGNKAVKREQLRQLMDADESTNTE